MVNIWSRINQLAGARCPLCHAVADGICKDCTKALPANLTPCPRCALPLPEGADPKTPCGQCQQHPPAYDLARVPLVYAPPVDTLIAGFKYRGRLALGRLLAGILAGHVEDLPTTQRPDLLLPVPMHASGLRERGFNQASELARAIASRCDLAWSPDRLQRMVRGQHQQGLDRAGRRKNLRGAFACTAPLPKHVAVIDDVVTTGATADEISRVLRQVGVERIEVWAVARTDRE
jgi:ComF family protein